MGDIVETTGVLPIFFIIGIPNGILKRVLSRITNHVGRGVVRHIGQVSGGKCLLDGILIMMTRHLLRGVDMMAHIFLGSNGKDLRPGWTEVGMVDFHGVGKGYCSDDVWGEATRRTRRSAFSQVFDEGIGTHGESNEE